MGASRWQKSNRICARVESESRFREAGTPVSKTPKRSGTSKKKIDAYSHADKKRSNNPPVGLVTPATDPDLGRQTYAYDPHLDPQLMWTGKAERTSFEIPTVSLHVHERIEPRTILEAVRKKNGEAGASQGLLFDAPEENLPLSYDLVFYMHPHCC